MMRKLTKKIVDYSNPNSFSSKLRKKRFQHIEELIINTFDKYGCVKIIDMGGTKKYWNIMPVGFFDKYNIHITIINLPGINDEKSDKNFSLIEGDCCNLSSYSENEFHISHSNSVIEHVGGWDNMCKFSKEAARVSLSYYVQTPNYYFPIEPHCMMPFFHWLSRQTRIFIILKINVGNWSKCNSVDSAVRTIDSAQLLNKKMFYALFDGSSRITERLFFLPKSIIALKNNCSK